MNVGGVHKLSCPAANPTTTDAACTCDGHAAPIGRYMTDLAILLAQHPAPWRVDEASEAVRDASARCIIAVDVLYIDVAKGLVAAVNLAAGLRP